MESRKAYPSPRCWKCFQYVFKCKSCEQHSTASAFHCDLWRENLRLFKASRPKRFPIFQAYLLGHPIFHSILMEYSFKLIHWNSFDCFFWNSYDILMKFLWILIKFVKGPRAQRGKFLHIPLVFSSFFSWNSNEEVVLCLYCWSWFCSRNSYQLGTY